MTRRQVECVPKSGLRAGTRNLESRTGRDAKFPREKRGGNLRLGNLVDLRIRVHGDHCGLVDSALQARQSGNHLRRPVPKVRPIKETCLVIGEMMQIVLKHTKMIRGNLRIGRIKIGHVNRPSHESLDTRDHDRAL